MRRLALLFALLVIAPPAFADSATDETDNDLRCVVVTMTLAATPDEKVRTAVVPSAFYFLGRIDGREPTIDFEARLTDMTEQMAKAPSETFKAEAMRCGAIMAVKGQDLMTLGKRMIEKGLKQMQRENSL